MKKKKSKKIQTKLNKKNPELGQTKNSAKLVLFIFGIGLPIIKVAKTNDKRGVGKLLQTFIVSFGKKCIAPNGPIDIPKIPDMTAIGNPNLSS